MFVVCCTASSCVWVGNEEGETVECFTVVWMCLQRHPTSHPPTYIHHSTFACSTSCSTGYYTLASKPPCMTLKRASVARVDPTAIVRNQSPHGSTCCVFAATGFMASRRRDGAVVCDKALLSDAGAAHLSNVGQVLTHNVIGCRRTC